jgi:hypothetical protein
MAYVDPRYLEHQRKRSTRNNAHLYIRHDAERFFLPGACPEELKPHYRKSSTYPNLRPSEELNGNLESERLAFRHELAKLRLDWELFKFALKGQKGGFNPAQPRDGHGRWAGEGDASEFSAQKRSGGIAKEFLKWTVRQFVSRKCKGYINREVPGQFEDMAISDLLDLAKGGDAAAKKCEKLLKEQRFRK